jgi:glycosyltransferase involved in cell wall biosynthesis
MNPFLLLTIDLLQHGGIQRVSRSLLAGLAEQGPVDAWSLHDRVPWPDAPPLAQIRAFAGSTPRFALAALRAALQPPRLVVAAHVQLAPIALPLAWRGSPLIIYIHGVEVWRQPTSGERLAMSRAVRVVANSRFTLQRMEEFYGQLPIGIGQVLPPGIADRPVRESAGEPHLVLMVGRMTAEDRYKGHDELLEIWPSIVNAVPDARLVFVGDGDDRARLEVKSRQLELSSCVEFTGTVDDQAIEELYARAAVVALASRFEGFGLVLLEAMRASRPVLAAPGAAEEIVEPEKTGLIADPAHPAALRTALLTLLGDPARARGMGAEGRRRFEERFTERRFHAGLRNVIAGIGAAAGSAPLGEPLP